MRSRFLLFLAFMGLLSGIALSQTTISTLYFPQVSNGGGFTSQFTISHTGTENRIVKIQFIGNDGTPLPIATLTLNGSPGAMPNCGIGCFAYAIGTGGYESLSAVTPGGETLRTGYAKVTVLSPDSSSGPLSVSVAMALNFGGGTSNEPSFTTPGTSYSVPFTDSATVFNGLILINPGAVSANSILLTLYDNADPPNLITSRMTFMPAGGQITKFVLEIFGTDMVPSGTVTIASTVPIFVCPIMVEIDAEHNYHYIFPSIPDQRTPEEKTEDLADEVGGLIDVEINPGQATGLQHPLDNALRSIEKGKIAAACSQLQDFIDEVIAKTPPLSQDTSNELIVEASAIRADLACPE